MHSGIYQASQGMSAQLESQAVITANLARHMHPGHRRTYTVFSADAAALQQGGATPAQSSHSPLKTTTQLDFSQGPLAPSDDPVHIAITGRSFFTVREADGGASYTRNGQFRVNSEGHVVTQDGAELLLEGGGSLRAQDKSTLAIQTDGSISQGDQSLGRLALVHFDDESQSLVERAHGRFTLGKDGRTRNGSAPGDQVLQRQLEGSNSDPILEMVSLIQVMRTYEANQKILAAEDETTGKLIRATAS